MMNINVEIIQLASNSLVSLLSLPLQFLVYFIRTKMIAKKYVSQKFRAHTPYGYQHYGRKTENQRLESKKSRLGTHSIQDRYLLKTSQNNKSETSLNFQQNGREVNLIVKKSNFQSLFPKIDVKMSIQTSKNQFYKGVNPNAKISDIQPKKKLIQPLSLLSSFQIREKHGSYYVSHEGSRIKNEDRISIQEFQINRKIYRYYGIFDGHGGHLAASYMAINLHLLVKTALTQGLDPSLALRQSLLIAEQKLKKNPRLAHKSGTCVLVCIIHQKECWIANVGDSRMLSISQDFQITQLTRDHKPEDQEERRRIQYYGGEVSRKSRNELQCASQALPFRVYPGSLSVSRTIGDICIKRKNPNLIIAMPDVYHLSTQKLSYLLLFTDGLYEKLTNKEICQFFLSPKTKLKTAIKGLYDEASNRESTDNRSLICVQIS